MGFLTSWGEKLGLYRATPAPAPGSDVDPAAAATAKKTVTIRQLQELLPDVPPGVFDKAPSAPPPAAEHPGTASVKTKPPRALSYDFDKVYEAARVAPPAHGWTIERVIKLLRTEQFKSMPPETVKQSLLGMLAAENVPAVDIVKDAIARDKAIDAFELHLRGKMKERQKQYQQQVENNRREIEALKAAMGDLDRQINEAETASRQEEIDLLNWLDTAKRAKEEDLARAVTFLTAEPVISIGRVDKPPSPPAAVAPPPKDAAPKPAPKGPPPGKGG
jgi:hypothetical protein